MKLYYDFSVKDVSDAYDGPVGLLWEILMGDHIHVGGETETKRLADKLKINENIYLLDVCSALGDHPASGVACVQFTPSVEYQTSFL